MHNSNVKSQNDKPDIIAALATPYGKSALAVIRVSGEGCIGFVQNFLKRPLEVGRLAVNTFIDGLFTERLMAVCYKAPRSYTGEDLVELYPHGNMTICDAIIKSLIDGGARAAERGEFTKRAFLNGKLDLMQCEALADIIDAQTKEQLDYGNKRFDGRFKALGEVENLLNRALSSVEAVLHYSDELEDGEIDQAVMTDVYGAIDIAISTLEPEIDGYAGGKIINDGFKIAIIGAPNVGKSTLLNALTDSDRAIVTEIAGTTRDTVDGEYVYNDRKFVVTDTAGLHDETTDRVEIIGMERAKQAAKRADGVVFLVSGGENAPKIENVANYIVVKNKCDGLTDVGVEYKKCTAADGKLEISAKNNINITALKQKLYELCPRDFGAICNHRQYDCAVSCMNSLKAARIEKYKAGGLEIVAALLYEAYSAIEQLYGEQADEKVIATVFERFCVGK
ncbi:MAG: tRNA uridine-5-carboxymethylaminomethyl(34) synthesis GTPase MnmE [Clostridiales bacterium]|nr:tRNA uridine-5-carboxymethylaminomethyl(34) synthesis GTPase MnmE [Clostridiales bacterium]